MSKRRRCRNVVTVVNVLKEQGVLTIDIQEAFRRGNVDALIFSNKDAVLIKHSCGAYMLWAATVEAGRLALREVPEMRVCVVHGQAAFEAIRCERKGFSVEKPCKQFCRYSMQRHKAKSPFPIRELTTDDLPQVAAHYKLESEEEIAATIEHGLMFGAEVDGELDGFIGMHTDGSVGMLEVFKKYRRCGVGSALVSHMNNYHADRGWTVTDRFISIMMFPLRCSAVSGLPNRKTISVGSAARIRFKSVCSVHVFRCTRTDSASITVPSSIAAQSKILYKK